jgi:hypothetical protein
MADEIRGQGDSAPTGPTHTTPVATPRLRRGHQGWLRWAAHPAVARLAPVAGFVLLALAIYAPALGRAYCVFGTDTLSHDYIMHLYGWRSIWLRGEIPLWCPYLFCGLPFIGSFALCPFYPSQLFYVCLPHNTAFTLQYAGAVALAGVMFYVWMRTTGVGRAAAAWGGALFMVSGHFLTLTHAGHLQKMIALAWAPGALAAGLVICRRARTGDLRAPALALGACLAMQLLASHMQIFYATGLLCLLGAAGVAVPLAARAWSSPEPGMTGMLRSAHALALGRLALALLAAMAFAGALSAVQMFPGYETARVSNRAQGLSFDEAVETSYPPAELLEFVIPSVFGDSLRTTRWGYFGNWGERIVSDYLGAPVLLLALVGLVVGFSRYRLFVAVTALLALIVGLGRHTPLYGMLYGGLPGFASFRSPGTFMFAATLGAVALAATGLDALSRRLQQPGTTASGRGRLLLLQFLFAALTGAGLALAVVAIWRNWGVRLDIATPAEMRRFHLTHGALTLGWQLAAGAGLGWVCLRAALAPAGWGGRLLRAGKAALLTLAVLAPALTFLASRRYVQFEPLDRYMEYLTYQNVYAALRGAGPDPVRLIEEKALKTDHILHGVGTPTGYHPVTLERYGRLTRAAGYATELFGDLFAIRYAHTYGDRPPRGTWRPLREFPGGETVWEWAGEPRPFAHGGATLVGVEDEAEMARMLTGGEINRKTFAATHDLLRRHAIEPGPQPNAGEVAAWSPGRIRLRTATQRPSILPLAEVHAPGWHARGPAGETLPIVPVNIALRGIVLSGGGDVEVRYQPFSYRLGWFVTALTMAALALAVVAHAHGRLARTSLGPQVRHLASQIARDF